MVIYIVMTERNGFKNIHRSRGGFDFAHRTRLEAEEVARDYNQNESYDHGRSDYAYVVPLFL